MTVVFLLGLMGQRIETNLPLDQLFLTHPPLPDQSPQIGSSEPEQAVPTAVLFIQWLTTHTKMQQNIIVKTRQTYKTFPLQLCTSNFVTASLLEPTLGEWNHHMIKTESGRMQLDVCAGHFFSL